MNKNDYSKFKYENSYKLKYSVDQNTQKFSTLNTELRTIKPNLGSTPMGSEIHLNVGQTIVTNYIYSCDQVNYVDQPINPTGTNVFKRVFFKLFNF